MDDSVLITAAILGAFLLLAWMSQLPLRYLRDRGLTEAIDHTVVVDLPLGEALARAQSVAGRALRTAGFELDYARSDELRWLAPREVGHLQLADLLGGVQAPGLLVRGTILGGRTALEIRGAAPVSVAAQLRGLIALTPIPHVAEVPAARPVVVGSPVLA